MMKEIEKLIEADREKTVEETKAEIARKQVANGKLSFDEIAEVTGLPTAEVEALAKEVKKEAE